MKKTKSVIEDNIFELSLKEHTWTKSDIGSNCISSLVNNRFSVETHIEQVRIQQPNEEVLYSYVNNMKAVLDEYSKNKALGSLAFEGFPELAADNDLNVNLQLPGMKTFKPIDKRERARMASTAPLKDIPMDLFSRKDFELNNPNIFSTIVDYQDLIGLNNSETEKTHRLLNEKLASYRDTVQVQLLTEISNRSSSFLEAVNKIRDLKKEVEDAIISLSAIEETLKSIKDFNVIQGLAVIRLKQKLGTNIKMYGIVEILCNVQKMLPEIENRLKDKSYTIALDKIMDACRILKNVQNEEPRVPTTITTGVSVITNPNLVPQQIELAGINSIRQQSVLINEIAINAVNLMAEEFSRIVTKDFKAQLIQLKTSGSNLSGNSIVDITIQKIETEKFEYVPFSNLLNFKENDFVLGPREQVLKNELTQIVQALLKMDTFVESLNHNHYSMVKEIYELAEEYQPTLPSQTDVGKPSGEGENVAKIRSLDFEKFLAIMVKLYIVFLKIQNHSYMLANVIVKVLEEAEAQGVIIGQYRDSLSELPNLNTHITSKASPSFSVLELVAPTSEVEESELSSYKLMIKETKAVLYRLTEFTHKRCAKLIALRTDQNVKLNRSDFNRLFNISSEFILAGDVICRQPCYELKKVLAAQANSFVQNLHEEKTKFLVANLQNEMWMPVGIPIDYHEIVFSLTNNPLNSSTKPSHKDSDDTGAGDLTKLDQNFAQLPIDSMENISEIMQCFRVGEQSFYAVNTTLIFLNLLTEYIQCARGMPQMGTEVTRKLLEFLQLFKSQAFGLIGCSGAVQSGLLNQITAKHLALIPFIKQSLSSSIKDQELKAFDRIIGDYSDSQLNIHHELVKTMLDRGIIHAQKLVKTINWDNPDKSLFSSDGLSLPMYSLMNEVCTFHKLVCKYLPENIVRSIMNELFAGLVGILQEEFMKIELTSIQGRNRLLDDCGFLVANLDKLEHCDFPQSALQVFVMENVKIKSFHASSISSLSSRSTSPSKFNFSFSKLRYSKE